MKEEFNLKEKRFTSDCGWDVIQTEKVKEFIRLLREEIIDLMERNQTGEEQISEIECDFIDGDLILNKIDKLSGGLGE